jgi:hypothetical protein
MKDQVSPKSVANPKDGMQSPQMQSPANNSTMDAMKGIKDEKKTKPNDVGSNNPPSNGPPGQSTEGEILDAIEALSLKFKEIFQKHQQGGNLAATNL